MVSNTMLGLFVLFLYCTVDFFFLNNYKSQTTLLVSQGLKLFWYLTNRVY